MRRWEVFRRAFPSIAQQRVLDLGGTVDAWRRAPLRPRHVTVLNLHEPGAADEDWVTPLTGDACSATAALDMAGVEPRFDVVFSNSLIEHVGGHARRQDLADQIRLLAPRHWVQTPYRYFPVEPHWLFPGMQFMPAKARVEIARRWPLVHTRPDTYEQARESVLWTELVGMTEMRSYFPASDIVRERACGVPKSLIAIR